MKNNEEIVYAKARYGGENFYTFSNIPIDKSLLNGKRYIILEKYNKLLKIIYTKSMHGNLNYTQLKLFDEIFLRAI